ncbi:PqqD family protein [Janibacter sp. DB-40]|uniref:PqqD family protein n=1 Tax=Janibacter sp. DB-40 TaxID=3028808 RepID=UPI0024049AE2|nr:PqqD family protein [Janibacter sp. DB-40]
MSALAPFVVPPDVGWTCTVDEGGAPRVFVAPLPSGPVDVLPDESAIIWLAAVEGTGPVVDEVARTTGHPPEVIREDVEAFVGELLARGFLARPG